MSDSQLLSIYGTISSYKKKNNAQMFYRLSFKLFKSGQLKKLINNMKLILSKMLFKLMFFKPLSVVD